MSLQRRRAAQDTAVSPGRLSRPCLGLLLAALLPAIAACSGTADRVDTATPEVTAQESVADELLVVTTTSILGDVVENLVGEDATVEVLMGPGVDPHAFEPSAAQAAVLRDADLVVANGLLLEERLVSMLEAAEADGVRVFELAGRLDPIDMRVDGHGHDAGARSHGQNDADDEDERRRPEDPHVWFDPVRMAEGVELIAAELAEADDGRVDDAEWSRRGSVYADELLTVHEELKRLFASIPPEKRQLVTNHEALGYLVDRYDFEWVGSLMPDSSHGEPDPRHLAQLIQIVQEAQVPVIFAERTDSSELAEQLAREVDRGGQDIEVVGLYTDALGPRGSGADTYLGLLRTNAERIAETLS